MPEPRRGELWRVDFNPVVGREQGEIRPALVLSVDAINEGAERSIVAPLTKTLKNLPTWVSLSSPEGGIAKTSSILCDQIRSVSHARFAEKLGSVSPQTMDAVEKVVKRVLGFH